MSWKSELESCDLEKPISMYQRKPQSVDYHVKLKRNRWLPVCEGTSEYLGAFDRELLRRPCKFRARHHHAGKRYCLKHFKVALRADGASK